MTHLFVDNDACPVKDEILKVAARYWLEVTMVSNQGMRPLNIPYVKQIVVSDGFDAADDWIVEHAAAGDIVITADIPLASRCVKKGCKALSPAGRPFTEGNIGIAMASRELSAHLRQTGESSGHNPSFSKTDRSRFLQALDLLIQQSK